MTQCTEKQFTVLYIEDDPMLQELVQYIISARSYIKMLNALSASDGLEMIRKHHPDLVLLDIQLPDGDGFALHDQMKSCEDIKDIPVVGLTSLTKEQFISRGLKSGFKYYITKPIDVPEFLETLDRILDPQR